MTVLPSARLARRSAALLLVALATLAPLADAGPVAASSSGTTPATAGAGSLGLVAASPSGAEGGSAPSAMAFHRRLAAGPDFTCALNDDGTVRCWGANESGQLGNGGTESITRVPVVVRGVRGAVAIAAGEDHACALRGDGTVWCWGQNANGQLGRSGQGTLPAQVVGLTGVVGIAAGGAGTCAASATGLLRCWGSNGLGQLGTGIPVGASSSLPTAVPGVARVVQVGMSPVHTCILAPAGTVHCWGNGELGSLGHGVNQSSLTPVQVVGVAGATAIAVGRGATCALLSGGARCWGINSGGQLGNGGVTPGGTADASSVVGLSDAAGLSANHWHTCAWRATGAVLCWGSNSGGALGDTIAVGSAVSTPTPMPAGPAAVEVIAGEDHTCARTAGGDIRCWGTNSKGQVGGPSGATPILTPVRVARSPISPSIVGGGSHTCALRADTTVRCWGENQFGQLGDGTTLDRATQVAVKGLAGVVALSAGVDHNCAVMSDGAIRCWGANARGQLGNGVFSDAGSAVPVTVSGISTAVAVSAGGDHTCALLADGAVRCWGGNDKGQVGSGQPGGSYATPTTVYWAGLDGTAAIANAVSVSAGSLHSCATLNTGHAMCWGANGSGQLGRGYTGGDFAHGSSVAGAADVVSVSARYAFTCGLRASGQTDCWGWNGYGQLGVSGGDRNAPVAVTGLSIVVSLGPSSGHAAHTCVLLADGGVRCWGANASGELGNGTTSTAPNPVPQEVLGVTDAVAVTGGYAHSCAVLADGTARCWGIASAKQLGDGVPAASQPTPVEVLGLDVGDVIETGDAGGSHTCAVTGVGTVLCWGANGQGRLGDGTTATRPRPVTVGGITGATQVTAGAAHTCALLGAGTARCWGANADGQVGDGSRSDRKRAKVVSGLSGAVALAAGGRHTCALLATGRVRCWGANDDGQLGDGSRTRRTAPVTVMNLANAVAITAGDAHTCAVIADGTARCWGAGDGRIGDGGTARRTTPTVVNRISGVRAIAAGGAHTCALLSDGTARCWGAGGSGRIGDGTTRRRLNPVAVANLAGATAISAGGAHTCARDATGGARCWGSNASGQLGNGTLANATRPVAVARISGVGWIATGGQHTIAIGSTGTTWAWGAGGSGRLGDGTTKNRKSPVVVAGT